MDRNYLTRFRCETCRVHRHAELLRNVGWKTFSILVDRLELKPALFSLSLLAFPGIAVHRCVSLLALLGISCFFKLAWLRIAGHRLELQALLGYRFFLQDYIVFHSCLIISPCIDIFLLFSVISFFILALLSLLASPGIAGIAAYFSWHRWASFVVSLGIDWVSLDIAEYRRAWPGIAGHLRIVQGLAIYNCLY